MPAEKTKEEILESLSSEYSLSWSDMLAHGDKDTNDLVLDAMHDYSKQQNAALIAENKALQDIIKTQDELINLHKNQIR